MKAHIKNIIPVANKQLIIDDAVNESKTNPKLTPVITQYIIYKIIVITGGIFLIIPDKSTAITIGKQNITTTKYGIFENTSYIISRLSIAI